MGLSILAPIRDQALEWFTRFTALDENERFLGISAVALLAITISWLRDGSPRKQSGRQPHIIKHRSTPLFERLLVWLWPPADPVAFGHIVASFRHLPHMIVFGAPGSGKSTYMYNRILDPLVGIWALISFLTWGLLPRRMRRGKLIITGNFSAPFRAAVLWLIEHGWPAYIWTPNPVPGEGFGLDVLEGPADNVAEGLIAMQPVAQGNTGLQSGAVEGMIVDTCYDLERNNIPRTFATLLEGMQTVGKRPLGFDGKPDYRQPAEPLNAQEAKGLENWSTRIRTLTRRLGASIGQDVKLSEVLSRGEAILIEGSSYNNPNSIEPLMHLFVVRAMWLVGFVKNFDLIIDEPGAVGPGTFTRLLSATRAWGVKILIGMQSRKQVDDTLREMCHTVLLLGAAGDAPEARDFESKCVDYDVPPEDFVLLEPRRWYEWLLPFWPRRGLYALEGWLFCNGRLDKVRTAPCDLRILARWPSGSIPQLAGAYTNTPVQSTVHPYNPSEKWQNTVDSDTDPGPDIEVDETVTETTIKRPEVLVFGPPEMPTHWAGDPQLENIWTHTILPDGLDGDYESTYRTNGKGDDGRPMCTYKGDPDQPTQQWLVYALSLALADAESMGLDDDERTGYLRMVRMNMASKVLTVEHQCENKRCHRTEHLDWSDRGANVKLFFERRHQARVARQKVAA